jgi:predicted dehydrogenase
MSMAKKSTYGVSEAATSESFPAPDLAYQPTDPRRYKPAIGMIACGGITQSHLAAYKAAGYNVVALCDLKPERAESRRAQFFPGASVYTDYRDVLKRDDIEVVDIATHPPERAPLLKAAIQAGKHVLSQKPFVIDIDYGVKLCDLADKHGVKLAVNQNGRWAPHVAYIRAAVNKGLLGQTMAVHLAGHWNHNWVGTHPVFNAVHHIVLYDYAIHWFDMINCYTPGLKATRVYASNAYAPTQTAKPPLLGQAIVEFDGAQASLQFDASVTFGPHESGYIAGTKGTIRYGGPDLQNVDLTISTARGSASPKLEGKWFNDGFHGTMGELLCAIEKKREPGNSARHNLRSLELCFAAIKAADTGKPQKVGSVRKLPVSE